MAARDYVGLATEYITDILSGKIPANRHVRLACQRQQRDLERCESDPDWPFTFDIKEAEKRCLFLEKLPHIKGNWPEPCIVLQPWQCFVVCSLYGWKYKTTRHEKFDGEDHEIVLGALRRFRALMLLVPRKNAKTTMAAGLALSCFLLDGEQGAEVYSAATKDDQAREVFGTAHSMVKKLSRQRAFVERFGVQVNARDLAIPESDSLFRTVSKQADTLDGKNIHCVTIDELHAHKKGDLHNVLIGSMGSREQPMALKISTAGTIIEGICMDEVKAAKAILERTVDNEEYFGLIYQADEEDSWDDEEVWRKVNPNFGVSVRPDFLRSELAQAKASPAKITNFETKYLDRFVNVAHAYFALDRWDSCPNDGTDMSKYVDSPCWIGIDLAQKSDLCSVAVFFDRNDYYKLFVRNYVPKSKLTEDHSMRDQYNTWANAGFLVATEGDVTDHEFILRDVEDIVYAHDVQWLGFDPNNARELEVHWTQYEDFTVEAVLQRAKFLSEPQKKFHALVTAGMLDHGADPCLRWQASNVVVREYADETILFRKEADELKIDAMVAASMAIMGWMDSKYGQDEDEESVYSERGIVTASLYD